MSAHQTKQLTPLDEALALALEAAEAAVCPQIEGA